MIGNDLVRARGLVKRFQTGRRLLGSGGRQVHAVSGVDLTIRAGEFFGLVGESGSGKSTTGRMLIRLLEPDEGSVEFEGTDILALPERELRKVRRHFQIIFQDPYAALNPRMTVRTLVEEPLKIHRIGSGRADRLDRAVELLARVGLDRTALDRYPHEFSGGQRQRIGIARAIACSPRFLVADEPVSALDTPVQAQIINLMLDLREQLGLAYLFIAHDLNLVRRVCDRVAVMYLGKIVEEGAGADLYRDPRHPYTRALLASTPRQEPGIPHPPAVNGEPPSPVSPPAGCRFHPRCPVAVEECSRTEPELIDIGGGRKVACHLE
jgi:oligopeptide/dipeptide ABC transporter ATP-binding protein